MLLQTNRRQTEVWPQGPDNIVCVIRLVRVPDKANSDNLRGIHEDLSDPNPLPTPALKKKKKEKKRPLKSAPQTPETQGKNLEDLFNIC